VRPAYGIMQAISAEPVSILKADSQFIIKRKDSSSFFYFSPVQDVQLVNGSIQCIATCRELYSIEEGVQKIQIA
ncbi:MAG: hypothetical protein C4308_09650, partial [Chitinophagaceae bacterium]